LFSGEPQMMESAQGPARGGRADQVDRVAELELQVATLKQRLDDLEQQLVVFKQRFE
jgi:uncharacterized protein YceH (UPF0502 family)